MGNIYKKQQVSDYAHNYYSAEGNFGQRMIHKAGEYEQEAEKKKAEAQDTYSKAIGLTWQSSVNELLNNPKYNANPKAMQEELQKISGDISSQIVDDEVKENFLVNSEISSQTYINNAQKNFQRVQEEKRRSAIFDSVYSSLDLASASVANILSGNGTAEDAINFEQSRKKALANINARDEYGNYIFSDTQRLKMSKDIDKYALESFKDTYESLDESQQDILADKILNDESFDIQYKDGSLPVNPNKTMSNKMMRDIKNYVKKSKYERIKNEKRERELDIYEAEQDFALNPTEEGFEAYKKLNPYASEKKLDRMREILENSPNYEAETDFDGAYDATTRLSEISQMPMDSEKDRANVLDQIADYVISLNKANTAGKISSDDVKKQAQLAYRMFNDNVFKEQVHTIFGKPGAFSSAVNWGVGNAEFDRIESIGLNTIQQATQALMNNDPEMAMKIYKNGQEEAIRIRYPEIPFDKLKVGDIFWYDSASLVPFRSAGRALKFLGYSLDDVLVEVDPNTGAIK